RRPPPFGGAEQGPRPCRSSLPAATEPLAAVRRCGPGVQQLFGDLPEHAEDRLCTGDHQGDVQPLRCGGDGRGQAGEGTLEPLAQLPWTGRLARSEEHTSELQSRFDLVCRLLLEKKNE